MPLQVLRTRLVILDVPVPIYDACPLGSWGFRSATRMVGILIS